MRTAESTTPANKPALITRCRMCLARWLWQSGVTGPLLGLLFLLTLALAVIAWGLLDPSQSAQTLRLLLVLIPVGLLLIVLTAIRVQRQTVQPLERLRRWVTQMQLGHFDARIELEGGSAMRTLIADLNQLGRELQSLREDLGSQVRTQTEHLAQQAASLRILYDISASLNSATDLREMLRRFLYLLREMIGATAATVRLRTESGDMKLIEQIGPDPVDTEENAVMPACISLDDCLCGEALSGGQIRVQNDACRCLGSLEPHACSKLSVIAVPLQYHGETLGIYNLFVTPEQANIPTELTRLLSNIGWNLGMAVAKAQLEEEAHRSSIARERERMAHELHDSLAQSLASLRIRITLLRTQLSTQAVEQAVVRNADKIMQGLSQANREVRELIANFRAPATAREGLDHGIEQLVQKLREESSMNVIYQHECAAPDINEDQQSQLLRIAQESLTNIQKHSEARTVRLLRTCPDNKTLRLLVEDDGHGFDPEEVTSQEGRHIGLDVMRERARSIRAQLEIDSNPGDGTRVELTMPIQLQESLSLTLR